MKRRFDETSLGADIARKVADFNKLKDRPSHLELMVHEKEFFFDNTCRCSRSIQILAPVEDGKKVWKVVYYQNMKEEDGGQWYFDMYGVKSRRSAEATFDIDDVDAAVSLVMGFCSYSQSLTETSIKMFTVSKMKVRKYGGSDEPLQLTHSDVVFHQVAHSEDGNEKESPKAWVETGLRTALGIMAKTKSFVTFNVDNDTETGA